MNDYGTLKPIADPIPADRQAAKRHYGVHPYFTRRPFNVVRSYVLHYSREGDRVLDPFGGSGVTAIEAFLENRIGIQNDINPLANFIAKGIADLSKGNHTDYVAAFESIRDRSQRGLRDIEGKSDEDVRQTGGFRGRFEIHAEDIDDLPGRIEPVDYIFTDPPYGGHISYLDLSTLWNVWNGKPPTKKARERELIVGGDLDLSEDVYVKRLEESIRTCFALLKPGRWLSVVFQHWSVPYFDAILTGAASVGGDLRAAISQIGDPIWSMHKKKGNQSVLAGEMILTFLKTDKPKTLEIARPFDVAAAVSRILDESANGTIYGEYLFNRIVINAWQSGALGSLDISRTAFADLMEQHGWTYEETAHRWRRHAAQQTLLGAL